MNRKFTSLKLKLDLRLCLCLTNLPLHPSSRSRNPRINSFHADILEGPPFGSLLGLGLGFHTKSSVTLLPHGRNRKQQDLHEMTSNLGNEMEV